MIIFHDILVAREDLRRWFLTQELDLFRFRFQQEDKESHARFLSTNNLKYKPVNVFLSLWSREIYTRKLFVRNKNHGTMGVKNFRFLFNLLIRLLLSWEGKGQAVFSVFPLLHLNVKSNGILTLKKIDRWYFYHMNNFPRKRSRKKKRNSCNLNLLIISGWQERERADHKPAGWSRPV